MRITGFVWLEEIAEKLWQKHHVQQYEGEEVVVSGAYFRFVERGHRAGEDVYAALGQTDSGRYLIVFFVHKRTAALDRIRAGHDSGRTTAR